jgi:glutathione peroxidase
MRLRRLSGRLRHPFRTLQRRGRRHARALAPVVALVATLAVVALVWTVSDEAPFESAFAPLATLRESAAPAAPSPAPDDSVALDSDPLSEPVGTATPDAGALNDEHLVAAAASPIALAPTRQDAPAGCPALLARTFNRLQTGQPESLCQFAGKVVLVVNTASYCSYTHQYEGLEAMYRRYRDRGLVVVGFPSNDFGQQEPGSNGEIAKFCRLTYGVEFPMYEKSSVTDLRSNPLFADLAARTGKAPQWNFHKYVIDRSGQVVASFPSAVEPGDKRLVELVERLLDERGAGL